MGFWWVLPVVLLCTMTVVIVTWAVLWAFFLWMDSADKDTDR